MESDMDAMEVCLCLSPSLCVCLCVCLSERRVDGVQHGRHGGTASVRPSVCLSVSDDVNVCSTRQRRKRKTLTMHCHDSTRKRRFLSTLLMLILSSHCPQSDKCGLCYSGHIKNDVDDNEDMASVHVITYTPCP